MKLAAWVGGMTAAALVAVELSMEPDAGERAVFMALFAGVALVTLALGLTVPRTPLRSVRWAVWLPPMLAIGVAAATAVAAAMLMFLSAHDLRVVLAALGLGTGLAVALSVALGSRLEQDLRVIGRTARLTAGGDRSVRTRLDRPDEVGDTGRALDAMIDALAAAEHERATAEAARRLFASLGHDLRTPLTALQAAVEAMQDGVADDPGRFLRSMRCDIDAISGLVDDLLLISRLQSGELSLERMVVDLAEIADEAAEAIAPVALPRGIEVTVEASGNTRVHGGPRELGRAIRNLLDNALRHSPDRATVRVVLGNGGRDATLRVLDEGPGFGDDLRHSAFDAFTTGDPARRRQGLGSGLGLAIVRSVVEAHGGATWIEPGPGGRVVVRLPVVV